MVDTASKVAESEATAPPKAAQQDVPEQPEHPYQDPAFRRRIRRQARLMVLVAFVVLGLTLSIPFVLRYLAIKMP